MNCKNLDFGQSNGERIKATCEDSGSKTLNRVSSINASSVTLMRSYGSLTPFNSVCVGRCVTSQGTVLGFVLGEDVLDSTELFPQIYQFLPQHRILFLQEGGPAGDLVLFHPPCVSGAFGCQVVLPASGPVFVILPQKGQKRTGCDEGNQEIQKLPF